MQREIHSASVEMDLSRRETTQVPRESSNSEVRELNARLDEKTRECEKLNVLMESVAPIPGFDYDKYRKLVLNPSDEIHVDYRDSKIVSLAKKSRNLTMLLNKEKAENDSLKHSLYELNNLCVSLRDELSVSTSKRDRRPDMDESDQMKAIETLSKDLNNANKSLEELRRKYLQTKEESKNLKNALTRELGEGVTVEQALEGNNWRGRAQQIVMLKSKIRRLEGQLQLESQSKSQQSGVDAKAEQMIAEMDQERKQTIEAITEDYKRLQQQCSDLETKYASSRVSKPFRQS